MRVVDDSAVQAERDDAIVAALREDRGARNVIVGVDCGSAQGLATARR
jgi:hypothetical protein